MNKKVNAERMLNDADRIVVLSQKEETAASGSKVATCVSLSMPSFTVNSSITSHAYPPE